MPGMSQTGYFHHPFVQFRPLGVDRAIPFKNKPVPGRIWQPDLEDTFHAALQLNIAPFPSRCALKQVDDISSRVDPVLPFPTPILSCGLIEEVDIVLSGRRFSKIRAEHGRRSPPGVSVTQLTPFHQFCILTPRIHIVRTAGIQYDTSHSCPSEFPLYMVLGSFDIPPRATHTARQFFLAQT